MNIKKIYYNILEGKYMFIEAIIMGVFLCYISYWYLFLAETIPSNLHVYGTIILFIIGLYLFCAGMINLKRKITKTIRTIG